MKKKSMLAVCLLCASTLALYACSDPAGAGERVKPVFSVSQAALYCDLGDSATIPAAVDKSGSSNITVTVMLGSRVVTTLDGSVVNTFTPEEAGIYTVRYQAASKDGTLSDIKEVTLNVSRMPDFGAAAPTVTVDSSEVIFGSHESVAIRAASGAAANGDDLSASVVVRVYDDGDRVVYEGNGGVQNVLTEKLASGTYTVVYSLVHNGKQAEEKRYNFAVVSVDGIKPVLSAPIADRSVLQGKRFAVSSASAVDPIDGRIDENVRVRIENSQGQTVVADRAAQSGFDYVFADAGEYRVVYSVQNKRGAAGDELGYTVFVRGVNETSAITVDGEIDESQYATIPEYRFGMGGNVTYYFHTDADHLYLAADVKDETLVSRTDTDKEVALNHSDGLEFTFYPEDGNKLYITNSRCFRVRVGVDGTVKSYVANPSNDQWAAGSMDLSGAVAVKTRGTVAEWGAASSAQRDEGYSVELRLPWSAFGYAAKPDADPDYGKDYVRIGFGHRDVKSASVKNAYRALGNEANGGENNCFYNGMNYIGRPKVATEGLNPSLYSKLYFAGDLLGVDPVEYSDEVVLDGFMEASFWSSATDVPFGTTNGGSEVTSKAKLTKEGVYVGVFIADSQIVAEARGFLNNYGIFCNDCLDLRVVPFDGEGSAGTLVTPIKEQPCITDGKVIAFDPLGSAHMQMLHGVGINRTHARFPFAYGVTTNGTVAYCENDDKWNANNIFIADKNNGDNDEGWGVEMFLPWSSLNMSVPADGATVKVRILIAILDRNADPTGASWRYGICEQGGTTRATPSAPNTYFTVEKTI